ncbi:hypothetical protein E2C01_064450 [Portunus trituberculatus]|uniref:Uncharacterized protein n=1 Tax=Portunus trituberculatus TaxID=210409 RepID=A0A5B7HN91_PORTR|nr:hypothetical protein [Portunus trituberculatus]
MTHSLYGHKNTQLRHALQTRSGLTQCSRLGWAGLGWAGLGLQEGCWCPAAPQDPFTLHVLLPEVTFLLRCLTRVIYAHVAGRVFLLDVGSTRNASRYSPHKRD